MKFRIYECFETHPLQKKFAKWWTRKGFPLPERMKRQIANQIHAEMIARLMSVVVEKGTITVEQALQAQYELGQEIAVQTANFLSVASDDDRHLSSIIDFLHGLLDIGNKVEVVRNQQEVICHWKTCFLSEQLKTSKGGGGPYYCHL